MMLLARRGALALAAVLDIALHARPEPVAAKALANRLELPPRHLEPLLQALVRGGILRGVRGPRGGYELARERRRISVAEILQAGLAGPEASAKPTSTLIKQVIMPLAAEISEDLLERFADVSVDDLCARATRHRGIDQPVEPTDFTI
jgi:Rrf2 family transcriptional regulator, iron-sulfur cluster assembly transcription factor